MSGPILYAVGTSVLWFSWIFFFLSAVNLFKLILAWPGLDRQRTAGRSVVGFFVGAVLLGLGQAIPMDLGHPVSQASIRVPLFVPLMPLQAWWFAISILGTLVVASRWWTEIRPEVRKVLAVRLIGWTLASLVSLVFCFSLPTQVEVLRGAIALQTSMVVVLLSLAILTLFVTRLVAGESRRRNIGKSIVSHAVLGVGALIFGLPFLWMLLTSFKESRDVSSPAGMVWIPKVQQEVPFDDPQQPQYEGRYRGMTVRGIVAQTLPGGNLRIDIRKPYSLQGYTFEAPLAELRRVPKMVPLVTTKYRGQVVKGMAVRDRDDGRKVVNVLEPAALAGEEFAALPSSLEPVRNVGLRWQNYTEGLEQLPIEADYGLRYVANSAYLVFMITLGTLLSSSLVAYGFARVRFPGREFLFLLMLSTMMLPGLVTMLPQFLIWVNLGWMDTYLPIWVPAFFGSAFAIFLFRQFFLGIPQEFEDAAKIDGCSHLRTYWSVMLPQIKPALVTVAIGCFIGTWGDFLGPLIYVSSPEKVTVAYALQFLRNNQGDPGILMAFATMSLIPILLLFFIAQRWFIESVSLSGLGGR